ncbi:unnamed protein product [Mycena citricolor]|uniref:WD40 repeat-like protein n=1 Tax=Mycena citricolor TaxID=2018698 RepID=A0AAD2JU42_9AGAR|nr:unnamed protein product [Mycena citricolor]
MSMEAEGAEAARPTRRETILSLVEMLLQPGSGDLNSNQVPSFEDDKDVPSVDDHRQTAGAETFHKFQRRIDALDKQLRNFANATRQLGSSVAILSSAFHLRERIAQLVFLYRENAADLFPRKIPHATKEAIVDARKSRRRIKGPKLKGHVAPPHIARPTIDESLDLELFPQQFEALAENLATFGRCLNEFPEFNDESINASITSFEGDLRYWASCLKVYSGQFRYPAVQRYVHDLTAEMGEHLDSITSTLVMFVEIGVPTIRFGQRHKTDNLLNLSTVATFFSAVTATTLQFSYNLVGTPVQDAVNSFWFASLVFSIAAAVNSLLGLTWKQAMYRSPGHRVPWWVLIWIKRSPLVFLVMSVACFSLGLCLFAYASGQSRVTATITTAFTVFTSLGLVAVSGWFVSERWVFSRHRGRKWLQEVLLDTYERFMAVPSVAATARFWRRTKRRLRNFKLLMKRLVFKTAHFLNRDSDSEKSDDPEANTTSTILPLANGNGHMRQLSALGSVLNLPGTFSEASASQAASDTSPTTPVPASVRTSSELTPTPGSPGGPSRGKILWKNAMQTVKMRSVAAAPFGPYTPHRQRTSSSNLNLATLDRKRTGDEPVKALLLRSRVATLKPKLNALAATEALEAHQALVRHLQFSPDGNFLATSSWDRTSIIWRVEQPVISPHRVLAHPQGFVGQVAWSDTGNMLLTKLIRGVKVWSQDGVCQKTIDRRINVESIAWFPGSEAFLSVEENTVTKLDLRGNVLATYDFGRTKLHDVTVTPDGVRLLGVGPLLESPTGLHPSRSPAEKRLMVYNMETMTFEHQTPVLNDVRDVTLARNTTRNGLVALVSYENKAPPQLWKLDLVKDREHPSQMVARLTLRQGFRPSIPSILINEPDTLTCPNIRSSLLAQATSAARTMSWSYVPEKVSQSGDIHIWDQESGTLLRHIRAAQQSGDLTCIAWNHAAEDPFMFATGSHDGAVRIWTKPIEISGGKGLAPLAIDTEEKPDTKESEPVRSSSPFDMARTDSPLTQAEFESVETLRRQDSLGTASASSLSVALGTMARHITFLPEESDDEEST